MGTCISKMDSCIWKNSPKSIEPREVLSIWRHYRVEWRHQKYQYFKIQFLIRVALYMIYTHQSVTHTPWFIPYIKVYTVKIALDKKYFVKLSRGGERERNKKIFKSLYSATTLINLFDYFIEHLWRHVWLRYDVNFYDS